ncbi:SAYSvFN domain-containing protein 1 [Habropoda laboriosa]|uniref:SAYSvFN domain-containing protein 1 n=1 Tax=Habropoda laboriosa TaxID=597456 RepID=A0A0L7QTL4_9HYME|nr:PREDICTED: SAYSvFN domain-containing protein 1 [Habropoda laboriosa]KOC61965.1 SAYSvFN domain-containing protein 1 [Habropoda laboriosa]
MDGVGIKAKLDAYRRKKRKEEMTEFIKNAIQTVLPWNGNKTIKHTPLVAQSNDIEDVQDTESTCSDDSLDQSQCTMLTKVTYLLYFLLWAALYIIAIEYEFGAVYFVVSILVFICLNTRSKPKKPGELSAYSVFNPDCKAIEGTLDASQFEREIRYGIGSVH